MKLNVDAHLWCLGTYGERYVPGGYFEEMTTDQQLEIMSKIEGLTGLFTFYPVAPSAGVTGNGKMALFPPMK